MIAEFGHFRAWIEIGVLAVGFYIILTFIRGTRGAGILKGIVFLFIVIFLGLLYVADVLELERLRDMLRWVLSGSALALVILFAPELRRALSHLAQSRLLSPLLRDHSTRVVDELVNAAVKLSKNRIGALVAIERDVGLGEYVENGCRIDAQLTSELLETIFYPGSALHDGAVILQQDRAAAAGCLLPLTDDATLSKSMGTRHRAAIGIAEETDAVALVVSEETGKISVAANGKLTSDLSRESLHQLLTDLYARSGRSGGANGGPGDGNGEHPE
jgi:diadenylate cyclase